MDRRNPSQRQLTAQYLLIYNLVNGFLWIAVLGRVILLIPLVGFQNVYGGVGEFAKWVQSIAILEVFHSALGLVHSPTLTTVIQVSSRLIVTWGVVDLYPQATSPSPFYSSLLSAWSLTEVVRYGYFTMNLQGGVPKLLTWSRYSFFYVLYPVGMLSEIILIWKASEVASSGLQWAYLVLLLAYVPGSFIMYTHMIRQRNKVMQRK